MTKQAKIIITVLVIAVLVAVGFIVYRYSTAPVNLVGSDRDQHGCIGSAGYSWCEAKQKCLRAWEEKCEASVKTSRLSQAQARAIAEKICIKAGETLKPGSYNENSKTWWFDANLLSIKQGCNPACVVSEETKTAEINWRCTGLIMP